MKRIIRGVAVVALAVPIALGSAGAAFADEIISTPPLKAGPPGPGAPCLFVGTATLYSPLGPVWFTTDPDTGFYFDCNDVGH